MIACAVTWFRQWPLHDGICFSGVGWDVVLSREVTAAGPLSAKASSQVAQCANETSKASVKVRTSDSLRGKHLVSSFLAADPIFIPHFIPADIRRIQDQKAVQSCVSGLMRILTQAEMMRDNRRCVVGNFGRKERYCSLRFNSEVLLSGFSW